MRVQGTIDSVPLGPYELDHPARKRGTLAELERQKLLIFLQKIADSNAERAELEFESESDRVVRQLNSPTPDRKYRVCIMLVRRVVERGGSISIHRQHRR